MTTPAVTTHKEAVALTAVSADPSPGCRGKLRPAGDSPEATVVCNGAHPGARGQYVARGPGVIFVRYTLSFAAARVAVCDGCHARFLLDDHGRPHWIERGFLRPIRPRKGRRGQ